MRLSFIPGFMIGAAILTACNETTGSDTGRAEAIIQDTPTGQATVVGTLQGNIFASLSADGVTWVDLGSPNGITVTLQGTGTSTTVHGEEDAPAGSYTRVRLVLNGVTARLQAGSTVGGTTLTSDLTLAIGGSDNQVEVVLVVPAFTVETDDDMQRTVIFELGSQLWLTAAALAAGRVEDAALQAAMSASTRLDPR
ncbi:MAG: hypothetical protein ACT4PM_12930 [Gemmatimonadales bacterium]